MTSCGVTQRTYFTYIATPQSSGELMDSFLAPDRLSTALEKWNDASSNYRRAEVMVSQASAALLAAKTLRDQLKIDLAAAEVLVRS
jgi:hypothetical protein